MKQVAYPFIKRPGSYYYDFYSEGPNGHIRKVVEYYQSPESKDEVFNLSFGDWDDEKNCINDMSVSNNNDRDKVLATVAATVIDFIKSNPNAIIIAMGSTASRTRLYQMNISKLWHEIMLRFEIQGYINHTWQPFQKGTNYDAFLLKIRQSL